jgi:hypothetical protein
MQVTRKRFFNIDTWIILSIALSIEMAGPV